MLAISGVLVNYCCMSVEEQPDYLAIHDSFAATEHGRALAEQVRYNKYRPPGTSKERWEELLGPDVNNLDHLVDTYHLSCAFIRQTDRLQPGLLSQRDKAVLKVTAVIHDWGESILPDINYFEKTEADELAEQQAFVDNLKSFYPSGDAKTYEIIEEALAEIVFDRESRLGSMFNIIERIGYMRTCLRADRHARESTAPDCEDNLRWLAAAVLSSDHSTHLILSGDGLRATHDFLDLREPDITEALEAVDPDVFSRHEPDQATVRIQGLTQAQTVWRAWQAGINFRLR